MISLMLVEGLPGTGKTTLIRRLAETWGPENCTGFFTQEKREKGKRTGFYWEDFLGQRGVLADLQPGTPRVGKYRVDLESFERVLSGLLPVPAGKILLIDEVGKMECFSSQFREALSVWENADRKRIFTVPAHGTPFIEAFKSRNRAFLIRLNLQNRDEIFQRLSQSFASLKGPL